MIISKESEFKEGKMVRRIYVEKKEEFSSQAKDLKKEIGSYLGIKSVDKLRILIRYDVENVSDEVFKKAEFCRAGYPIQKSFCGIDSYQTAALPFRGGQDRQFPG